MDGDRTTAVLPMVLHHDYRHGSAADLSGHGAAGTVLGASFDREGLRFDGRHSRVVVPPSLHLVSVSSLRVSVSARLDGLGQRANLVEGYLAFALFAHADGSIQGGTYDGTGWHAVRTAAGAVHPGSWYELTLLCTGMVGTALYIGGECCAWAPRRSVRLNPVSWPFGLNVGAWPDADQFVLPGHVRELRIWAK